MMRATGGLLASVEPELTFRQTVTQALSPNLNTPSSNCFLLEGQRRGGLMRVSMVEMSPISLTRESASSALLC